jgi:hypothetical protein
MVEGKNEENYCLTDTKFQFYKMKSFEDRWWWWLYNIMYAFNATKLCTQKWFYGQSKSYTYEIHYFTQLIYANMKKKKLIKILA